MQMHIERERGREKRNKLQLVFINNYLIMQLFVCVSVGRDAELYNSIVCVRCFLHLNFANGKNDMIHKLIKKNGPLWRCVRIYPLALPNSLIKIHCMCIWKWTNGGCHFVSTLNWLVGSCRPLSSLKVILEITHA